MGERSFGAHGFRYCGSLLASERAPVFPRQAELLVRATALADAVTEAFGLRGLNGLDFVARDGVPLPIEVNPRYSASMELVERATGVLAVRHPRRRLRGSPAASPRASRCACTARRSSMPAETSS